MKPNFREDKAAQAAAMFLKLRGGTMSYLKLMKLLYLAEREAFLRLGRPIMFDGCVSMDHGPVLSGTLNLINGAARTSGAWEMAISIPSQHEVSLNVDPGNDKLSEAEDQIIKEVFDQHGAKSRWELCDFTHTLSEWQNPKGSSIRIDYREILRAGGKTEGEIESIMDDIEGLAMLDKYSHS
jgi:uncharacterized phage-associated protein